jgi:hypothetical protein
VDPVVLVAVVMATEAVALVDLSVVALVTMPLAAEAAVVDIGQDLVVVTLDATNVALAVVEVVATMAPLVMLEVPTNLEILVTI